MRSAYHELNVADPIGVTMFRIPELRSMLMSSLLRGLGVLARNHTRYAPVRLNHPYQPVSDGQTYEAYEDSHGSSPSTFPLPVASVRFGGPWAFQLRFRPRRYQRRRVAWEHRLNTSRSISLMVLSHMRPHVTLSDVYRRPGKRGKGQGTWVKLPKPTLPRLGAGPSAQPANRDEKRTARRCRSRGHFTEGRHQRYPQ